MQEKQTGTVQVKRNFPEMLKGGVICDVVNAEQARIAEEAGASAVMALERVPADIRVQGGVSRMSDPELIIQIKEAVETIFDVDVLKVATLIMPLKRGRRGRKYYQRSQEWKKAIVTLPADQTIALFNV